MDLLRALGTFTRIVETGSFSAVARETNTSSSAVTRLVGQLEEHFRLRLFHRTTRHLSLTEDGLDLLRRARHIIEAASELEDTFGHQHAEPRGRVRVGLATGTARLLIPAMSGLLDRHPGLSLEFIIREQFHDLIEDRLDLAVRTGQPTDASVVARPLGEFGRALVASPSYLEKRGAPSAPADLVDHNCIVQQGIPGASIWHFNGPGGPHIVRVNSTFGADSAEVLRQAALTGNGIALLSEPQVFDDILGKRLYRLLPNHPTERLKAFLVYPSRHHLPQRTRVVIDCVIERSAVLGAGFADNRLWASMKPSDSPEPRSARNSHKCCIWNPY